MELAHLVFFFLCKSLKKELKIETIRKIVYKNNDYMIIPIQCYFLNRLFSVLFLVMFYFS